MHLVFDIVPNEEFQRRKIKRMRVPSNLSSYSYPSTWEIHVQTVTENVSKTSSFKVQLRNKIVVVAIVIELQVRIIFQHV
jgi:hypothetical protein